MSMLIIGSGAAALSAIKAIRSNEPEVKIRLITNEDPPFYYRPMIPLIIDGSRTTEDIKLTFDPVERFDVELVHGTVVTINSDSRTVSLSDSRTLSYEKLLIASGSSPVMPEIEGIKGEGVFTLRTIEDALKIRAYCENSPKVAVVGGGFVGIKVSAALIQKGIKVTIIEQLPFILYPCADRISAEILSARLKKAGIEIITGERVTAICRDKGRVKGLRLSSKKVDADMVIVAAGVKPNAEFLDGSSVRFDRGILVDEYLQTSVADVYAAGDVVQYKELITGATAVGTLWCNAPEMGKVAGSNMSGSKVLYEGLLPAMHASDIEGIAFISVGIIDDESGEYEVYSYRDGENYRKILFGGERIVGFLLTGDISRAGIFTNLLKNRIPIGGKLKDEAINKTLHYIRFHK